MQLPTEKSLPIYYLAGVFNHTTNSYKFYWFLAILNSIKKSKSKIINIEMLIIEMISEIWYPTNYFNLSFGKQDKFSKAISDLVIKRKISVDIKKEDLVQILKINKDDQDIRFILKGLSRYVPYRFISS